MNLRAANKLLKTHGVKLVWAMQGKARRRVQVLRLAAPGEPFQTYAIGMFEDNNLMNGLRDRTMKKAHGANTNRAHDGWYLDAHRPGFQNMTPPQLTQTELQHLSLALWG